MTAIILAAGLGSRLKPYTDNMPKCMTRVGNITIIEQQLNCLKAIGVKEVVLVIGHLGFRIMEAIGYMYDGMRIYYAVNSLYDQTNTCYSFYLGFRVCPELKSDLFVLEGDVIFEARLLQLIANKNDDEISTIANSYNPSLDGSFVDIGNNGFVKAWIHKSAREADFTAEDKFKTVNIHKIPNNKIGMFYDHLKKFTAENKNKPIEYLFDYILDNKSCLIKTVLADDYKWFEIDTSDELKIAEKMF